MEHDCLYWLDIPNNYAQSIGFIFSSSHNQPVVPFQQTCRSQSEVSINDRVLKATYIIVHNTLLFSWKHDSCKVLPVDALTTWPRSCFVEITSHFFPSLFPKDLLKVCRSAEVQFRSFQQQSVAKHFKWKLICDLHGQWGENELMKCCKWNIRQGAVGESRQRW